MKFQESVKVHIKVEKTETDYGKVWWRNVYQNLDEE